MGEMVSLDKSVVIIPSNALTSQLEQMPTRCIPDRYAASMNRHFQEIYMMNPDCTMLVFYDMAKQPFSKYTRILRPVLRMFAYSLHDVGLRSNCSLTSLGEYRKYWRGVGGVHPN